MKERITQWMSLTDLLRLEMGNPVFEQGLHRVRRVRSLAGLRRYTRRVLIVLGVLSLIVFGLVSISFIQSIAYYGEFPDISGIFGLTAAAIIYVSVYTLFIPEFTTLLFSAGIINNERLDGRYDLARLAIGEADFVHGQYALGVVKAWRVASIWALARLISMVYLAIAAIFYLFEFNWTSGIAYDDLPDVFATLIIWGAVILVSAVVAWLESFWRLRMTAAVGVFVSARTKGAGMATFYGVFLLILLYTGFSIASSVISVPIFFVAFLGSFVGGGDPDISAILWRVFLYIIMPIVTLVSMALLYGFYAFVTRGLIKSTIRYLETKDEH